MLFYLYLSRIRRQAHDLPWVHLSIGAFGNLAFVVGSLFFLSPTLTRLGTWLFVVASWGMFIGACGEIMVRYESRKRAREAGAPGSAGPDLPATT